MRLPLTLAALAVVPLALYARVATFDYVQADDTDLIRDNVAFLQNLGNAGTLFGRSYFEAAGQSSDRKTYYRPLVVLSFMLDAQAGGAAPRAYHVTNVALHVAAVLLLFALLRALEAGPLPAFLGALLFAVHPANVQAIAWIPGRNDTLMAVFALASLVALVKYARTARAPWLALHAFAFAAALFTKESALALGVLFVLGARLPPRPAEADRGLRSILMVDLAAVALWYAMRQAALAGGSGSDGPGIPEHVATVVRNLPQLVVYAGKIALPLHLNVMPGLTRLDAALGLASVACLAWLLSRLDGARRRLVLAWLLLFLAPALLIPGLPAYEHRLYFPLAAVMAGVAALPVWRDAGRRGTATVAAMAIVQIVFAAIAFSHTGVFRDRYAYWTSATTGTPYAGIARVNLGQIAESDGDFAAAAGHYRAALEADPTTPGAHNNLGVLAARRGDVEEARAELRREVERHPANADAYFNLGLLDKLSNRIDAAAPWWEQAVAADPGHVAAHEELAAYYAAKGDAARAARHRDTVRALGAPR